MKNSLIALLILLSSQLFGQCFMDRHNTSITDSWVSCFKTSNPNPERPSTHWIMYDLGSYYELGQSTIWNLNNPDMDEHGVKTIAVDYASDPNEWNHLGEFTVEQSAGNSWYEGEETFDFDNVYARFVLITAINTHGDGSCAGFSELKIETKGVSSISEEVTNNYFSIAPNPSSDYVIVTVDNKLNDANYQIINAEGKIVAYGMLTNNKKLSIGHLSSGLYQCVLVKNNLKAIQKFQVIH